MRPKQPILRFLGPVSSVSGPQWPLFIPGILVAHKGRLVYERYAPTALPSEQIELDSAAKTVSALLLGVLVTQGWLGQTSWVPWVPWVPWESWPVSLGNRLFFSFHDSHLACQNATLDGRENHHEPSIHHHIPMEVPTGSDPPPRQRVSLPTWFHRPPPAPCRGRMGGKLDIDRPLAQYKVKPAAYWGHLGTRNAYLAEAGRTSMIGGLVGETRG